MIFGIHKNDIIIGRSKHLSVVQLLSADLIVIYDWTIWMGALVERWIGCFRPHVRVRIAFNGVGYELHDVRDDIDEIIGFCVSVQEPHWVNHICPQANGSNRIDKPPWKLRSNITQ